MQLGQRVKHVAARSMKAGMSTGETDQTRRQISVEGLRTVGQLALKPSAWRLLHLCLCGGRGALRILERTMSGKQLLLHEVLAQVVTGVMLQSDEWKNEAAGRTRAFAEEASQMPKRGEDQVQVKP